MKNENFSSTFRIIYNNYEINDPPSIAHQLCGGNEILAK
jgi:hypothetical protein